MLWHQKPQTEWCSVMFMLKGMGISMSPWLYRSFSTHWPISAQSDSTAGCSKMQHFYSFPENWQPDKEESWKLTTRYRKKWLIHSIGHQQNQPRKSREGGGAQARGLWLHLHKEAKEGRGSSTSCDCAMELQAHSSAQLSQHLLSLRMGITQARDMPKNKMGDILLFWGGDTHTLQFHRCDLWLGSSRLTFGCSFFFLTGQLTY